MSTDTNKAVVSAFYAALERGDFAALGQYCHKDFVFYSQVDTPKPGVDGFIASERAFFEECVDWKMPIHHMIAEGDTVVTKAGAFVREGDRINPVRDPATN